MEITNIRVKKIDAEGKLKAVVSVTFDDVFVVHDMKIIQGQEGLFISMPNRKMLSGEYRDVAHPISPLMRKELHKKIIEEYEKEQVG